MPEPLLHFPVLGLPLDQLLLLFLQELGNANRSRHTITNYRADIGRFIRHVGPQMPAANLSRTAVQNYLSTLNEKAPATRARHQASLRAFLRWCHAQGHSERDAGQHLTSVRVPQPYPRALDDSVIARVLDAIPADNLRDRLLFTLVAESGMRISEALGIYYEDLDLAPDDEKIAIQGKGGRSRTVMLYAAPQSMTLLRRYLSASRIASGPLFRAQWRQGARISLGARGSRDAVRASPTRAGSPSSAARTSASRAGAISRRGAAMPLHYRTAHHNWKQFCESAGVEADIHALRHSYATTLVNSGVRLEVVRRLLGHKSMQTTLRYAEVNDQTVKAELRQHMRGKRFN